MANRNTQGFGLIPAGRLGGGPSIQGQGKYKIDAGHSTTIYNGECVKISSGYVVGGNGSAADIIRILLRKKGLILALMSIMQKLIKEYELTSRINLVKLIKIRQLPFRRLLLLKEV